MKWRKKLARVGVRPILSISLAIAGCCLAASVFAEDIRPPAIPTTAESIGPFQYVGQVNGTADPGPSRFCRDGAVFTTSDNKAARVWEARTLKPLTEPLRQPDLGLFGVSADGKTAFTANDLEVRIWDVATSKLRSSTRAASVRLLSVDISPDGRDFLTVDVGDHPISSWHAGEARPRFSLDGAAISAEFNPAGTAFVVNLHRKEFRLHAADTGRVLFAPIPSDDTYFTPCRARFTLDGRRLVAARKFGFVVVDTTTGKTLTKIELNNGEEVREVRFSPDGQSVVLPDQSANPGAVRVYDIATGKLQHKFGSKIDDCQIIPGGRLALCSRWPAAPELWDLTAGKIVQVFPITGEYDTFLSPEGSVVLFSPTRGLTQVWHLRPVMPVVHP